MFVIAQGEFVHPARALPLPHRGPHQSATASARPTLRNGAPQWIWIFTATDTWTLTWTDIFYSRRVEDEVKYL